MPSLDQIRLIELKPSHISSYLSSAKNRGLSNRTLLHHFRLLHKALGDSVKLGLLSVNLCDAVEPPKPTDKEMNILLPGNVGKFLSASTAERFDKFLKPWLDESEDVGKMSAIEDDSDTRLEGFEPTTLGSEDRCSVR